MRLPLDRWIKKFAFELYAPYGWARSPRYVTLDLTRRCNLRCNICFYYGSEKESFKFDELSEKEIISRIINRFSGINYYITGGEPFLRNDILNILRAIRQNGSRSSISTNGTLITSDLAKSIIGENLLDLIHVSIYGLEKTHDNITRFPNSISRSLKGIEYLLNERRRLGLKKPGIGIACTITRTNMNEVKGLIELAESIGLDEIVFGQASFSTPEITMEHQKVMSHLGLKCEDPYDELLSAPPDIEISQDDLECYIETLITSRIKNIQKIHTSPKGYTGEDIRKHYTDLTWKYKSSCTYPWHNLRVGPDGTVTPCVGYVVGNVRDKDIKTIWNNTRFRNFRSILYKQKLFPGCVRCCKLK